MKTTKTDAIKKLELNREQLKQFDILFDTLEREKYLLILQKDICMLNIDKYSKIIQYYDKIEQNPKKQSNPL